METGRGQASVAAMVYLLDADTADFLASERGVVLYCRDSAGHPIGYPMQTVACSDQAMTFTTYRKSAKVHHLERDPRVCVLAAHHRADHTVRWASVTGRAHIVAPSETEIEATFAIRQVPPSSAPPGATPRVPPGMSEFVKQRLREGKRVLILVDHLETSGLREGALR